MKDRRALSLVLAAVMCLSAAAPVYADAIEAEEPDTAAAADVVADTDTADTGDTASDETADAEDAEAGSAETDTDDKAPGPEATDAEPAAETEDPAEKTPDAEPAAENDVPEDKVTDEEPTAETDTTAEAQVQTDDAQMSIDEAIARAEQICADDAPAFEGRDISDEDMDILKRVISYRNTGTDPETVDGDLYTDEFSAYASVTHKKPAGSNDYYYDQMNDQYKQAYDMCVAELEKFASSSTQLDSDLYFAVVDLPGKGWTKESIDGLWTAVFWSNPQYWFFSPNWVRNAEDDGSGALALKALDVAATPSGRSTNKAKITNKTNKWLNAVSSLPSDRQKTEKLAELIGKDITYDPTVASGSEPDKPYVYCMYGVFCTSTAVCQGYAHAMQYMCSLLGIDCIMVGTEIHSHAWNRVKLNGVWYETDLTWYDEDVDAGDDDPEQWINVSSQYLRSCEYDSKLDQWTRRGYSASSFEFSPSHEPDDPLFEIDFGGKKIRLPECTHTTPYMAFAEVSYSGGNAVVSWKAIDSGIDHYDVWIYNSKTGLFDDIADVNGTSYTLTSKMLGGQKSKVVIMSDDVWRTMDTDGIDIDLGHVHTYGSAEWKWTKDKSGKVTGATVTIQCTGCDRKVTTAAKITEKNGTITGTAVIDGKTYTQKYSEPPRTPTVVVKIAFGGRTVQLNCADKDAEIYYQFGSSNITTKCAHVKAGSTIFLDEPMTGTKAAMYFKSLKNGLWSPLGKWGVLNVQIDKPLLRAKGSAASGNFMIYTQTKNSYIVYTLDGSVPSIQEGIQQLKVKNGRIIWGTQGSVNVPAGRTLKAIAVRSGLVTSEVMTYTNVQKQVPAFPDPARYGFTNIKFYDGFKDYKYADMITTTTKASAISALNNYNAALKQKGFTLKAEIDGEYNSSKGYYGWYYTIKYDGKEVGIVMALLYDKTSKYELVLVVDDK